MDLLEFTQEEIGNQGRANAKMLWLAVVSYFQHKSGGLEEFLSYVGKLFAPSWEGNQDRSPKSIATGAVLNWISCGGKLVSFTGDETRAEAVMEIPPEEIPAAWGITPAEVHQINAVFLPIAALMGVKFDWQSEGQQFRMIFTQ